MKLSEIKTLNEGRVPALVKLTIEEIVKHGKITNMAQAVTLANVITFLQLAKDPSNWSSLDEYRDSALHAPSLVDELLNSTPTIQLGIANEIIVIMNSYDTLSVLGTSINTVNFMNSVLQAQ